MSRGLSLYLDGLRMFAALIVLLSHFAYARFTDGDYLIVRELNLGSDAVILFFVLSGFVIAFAAHTKDSTWKRFAFNRATRLYSVAIPAVAVTLVFDAIGSAIDPAAYDGWWRSDVPIPLALPVSLLFAHEWGALGIRLGTNGPYWSLSYEAAYYVLFGLAVYLRGPRRLLLLAAAGLVFGIKVLLLMPAWILGAAVYRRLAAAGGPPGTRERVAAAAIAAGSAGAYVLCLAAGVPDSLSALSTDWLGAGAADRLRFSDEFLWNALIGGLFAAHLHAMGVLLRRTGDGCGFAGAIRWLAGASFSIYLVHYPALQLIDAVLPDTAGFARDLVLLAATLAACLAFAQVFERPLPAIRNRLRRIGEVFARRPAGGNAI